MNYEKSRYLPDQLVSQVMPLEVPDHIMAEYLERRPDSREFADAAIYHAEVGRYPLLSSHQVSQLFEIRDGGLAANQWLIDHEDLSPAEKEELECYVEIGKQAEELIINSNLRMSFKIAAKYIGHGVPFVDLVQEANLGLIRAVKKFERQRGNAFSTYAYNWILVFILDFLNESGGVIKLPKRVGIDVASMLKKLGRVHHAKSAEEMNPAEIAGLLKMPVQKVTELLEVIKQKSMVSLDLQPGSADGLSSDDYYSGLVGQNDETELTAGEIQQIVLEALENTTQAFRLNENEDRVIRLRFGLSSHPDLVIDPDESVVTYEDISKVMGVTKSRTTVYANTGFQKMRDYLAWKHPNLQFDYLDFFED